MTNASAAPAARQHQHGLPQSAAVLAYAGALPPIVAALLIWLRPADFGPATTEFLLIYGGALIVFFGGVRWGVTVMRAAGPTFSGLVGAVLPLMIALPIFLVDNPVTRFLIIIAVLPILLLDDLRATRRGSGAPEWYLGVRAPMTILLTASYLLALFAVLSA